jgi:hypothetical protein
MGREVGVQPQIPEEGMVLPAREGECDKLRTPLKSAHGTPLHTLHGSLRAANQVPSQIWT